MREKAVISLYSFPSVDTKNLGWEAALDLLDKLPSNEYSCRNVLQFSVSVEMLTRDIEYMLRNDEVLRADIARETDMGANYMFIQPSEGAPVWGVPLPLQD